MRELSFEQRHPKGNPEQAGKISNRWGFNKNGFYYLNGEPKGDHIQCQYTGVKDKNGLKIHEGDIVKLSIIKQAGKCFHGCAIGEIVINKQFGVCLKYPKIWDEDNDELISAKTSTYIRIASYRSEILGNIYENPELLK